ncbi:hypothetical protein BIV59_18455 [Bacillus sp. MUM 13]|nr:hypothetical protein BIV59_18455 [Bacillus sp. MUM 13]
MFSNLASLLPQKTESQKEDLADFVTPYIWLFVALYVTVARAKQAMKSFLEIRNYESSMIRNERKENHLK